MITKIILPNTTYLVLGQIVWQISNHDLGCRWDTVLRRATLLWLARSSGLLLTCWSSLVGVGSDVREREWVLCDVVGFGTISTPGTATSTTTTATSTSTTTASGGSLSLALGTFTGGIVCATLFGLASKLNRYLALEYVLS
jgi:hypothetical protein